MRHPTESTDPFSCLRRKVADKPVEILVPATWTDQHELGVRLEQGKGTEETGEVLSWLDRARPENEPLRKCVRSLAPAPRPPVGREWRELRVARGAAGIPGSPPFGIAPTSQATNRARATHPVARARVPAGRTGGPGGRRAPGSRGTRDRARSSTMGLVRGGMATPVAWMTSIGPVALSTEVGGDSATIRRGRSGAGQIPHRDRGPPLLRRLIPMTRRYADELDPRTLLECARELERRDSRPARYPVPALLQGEGDPHRLHSRSCVTGRFSLE